MDPVSEPLQWWAEGNYREVERQLNRRRQPDEPPVTRGYCRRLVHALIRAYYRRTGNPIWKPIGHRGYEDLRRKIRENQALDHELT